MGKQDKTTINIQEEKSKEESGQSDSRMDEVMMECYRVGVLLRREPLRRLRIDKQQLQNGWLGPELKTGLVNVSNVCTEYSLHQAQRGTSTD